MRHTQRELLKNVIAAQNNARDHWSDSLKIMQTDFENWIYQFIKYIQYIYIFFNLTPVCIYFLFT